MAPRRPRPLPAEWRKRRIYDVLLPAAGAAALVGLVLDLARLSAHPFYLGSLSVFVVGVLLLFVASRTQAVPLEVVELGTLALGVVGFAVVVWYDLYVQPYGSLAGQGALAMFLWLPVLDVLVFLAFDDEAAWRYATALLTLVIVMTLPHGLASRGAGAAIIALPFWVQIYVADAVLVLALYFLARFQRRLQRVEATAEAMRALAHTDSLTGIANRRSAEHTLRRELQRAERYGRPLSLLILDLDDFKRLNDTLGHPAGDAALMRLSERLQHMLRESDSVARWGGEEFVIVAPETTLADARRLAEVVRQYVSATPVIDEYGLGASVGVASRRPGDRPDTLVARADAALYLAKQEGKACVRTEADVASGDTPAPRG